MAKVSLTLGESKGTKSDLTLESKDDGKKWADAGWTWDTADSTWAAPKGSLGLESKGTKLNLSLESK